MAKSISDAQFAALFQGPGFQRRLRPLPQLPQQRRLNELRRLSANLCDLIVALESAPASPTELQRTARGQPDLNVLTLSGRASLLVGPLTVVFEFASKGAKMSARRLQEHMAQNGVSLTLKEAKKLALSDAQVRRFGGPRRAALVAPTLIGLPEVPATSAADDVATTLLADMGGVLGPVEDQLDGGAIQVEADALAVILTEVYRRGGSDEEQQRSDLRSAAGDAGFVFTEEQLHALTLPTTLSAQQEHVRQREGKGVDSIRSLGGAVEAGIVVASRTYGIVPTTLRNGRRGKRSSLDGLLRRPQAVETRIRFALSQLGVPDSDIPMLCAAIAPRVRLKTSAFASREEVALGRSPRKKSVRRARRSRR